MRFTTKYLMLLTVVVAVILAVVVSVKSAIEPRFVSSIDHPNGSRLRVVQTFSYGDLFNTSIYFDDGDGRWRWYYFDHDDSYWQSADSQILGAEVHIKSDGRKIMFNVETGECTIQRGEGVIRSAIKSTDFRMLPKKLADTHAKEEKNSLR